MPSIALHTLETEWQKNRFWPCYWLHGVESFQIRSVVEKIQKALFGESDLEGKVEILTGETATWADWWMAWCTPAWNGPLKLMICYDVHLVTLNEAQLLTRLGPVRPKEELQTLCIAITQEWDARKKLEKFLLQQTAVVHCAAIPEFERVAWIKKLCLSQGIELGDAAINMLAHMEPWSLDRVLRELEKWSLYRGSRAEESQFWSFFSAKSEVFIQGFFARQSQAALQALHSGKIFDSLEDHFLLLGLLNWYLKQWLTCKNQNKKPWVNWSPLWSSAEIMALQLALFEMDRALKQGGRLPVGLWVELTLRFCRHGFLN